MSLFRQVSKWSLRALLAWGAIEAGSWAYATGAETAMGLGRLAGHRTAVTRLEERARAGEQNAATAEAALAGPNGEAWVLPLQSDEELSRAAERALRAELIALGAQAVTVDAEATGAGQEAARVVVTARWREPAVSSPEVVRALAQRFPHWRVERLALTRGDPVSAELAISIGVRAPPQQEAAR